MTGGGDFDIAVIGMALRVPGADTPEAFWTNLRAGTVSLRRFGPDELLAAGVPAARASDPDYVPVAGAIDGIELFDADFFKCAASEVALMDPQQRLLLETAWTALEDAGYPPGRVPEAGIYVGCGANLYLSDHLLPQIDALADRATPYSLRLLNEKDFLASRVAYHLDLGGPAVSVQTACSTSLVAAHQACLGLIAGECAMALAGGVSLQIPQQAGYLFQPGMILSREGRCRPFDAEADGAVGGSGAGLVVLKRLADAVADGDTIHAVIRGSAIGNDGAARVGFTAPGVRGQASVIRRALEMARLKPEDVAYVEAHGTATRLGDPLEVQALREALGAARAQPLLLGSVKANIGHLDAAAGVVGLIKAVLALSHGELPPMPGFRQPNSELRLGEGPFEVVDRLRPWPARRPRVAGVSSFGMGGTNAHMVVSQAPEPPRREAGAAWHLILLSAPTPAALSRMAARLAGHLEAHPSLDLRDVAYTLAVGRGVFAHRRFVVAGDVAETAAALRRPFTPPVAPPAPLCLSIPAADYHRAADFAGDLPTFAEALAGIRRQVGADDPAFTIPCALAQMWMEWGADPSDVAFAVGNGPIADFLTGASDLSEALRDFRAGDRRARQPSEAPARLLSVAGTSLRDVLTDLGRLWQDGAEIDWTAVHGGAGRRIPLPTYPFERQRYWIEPPFRPRESLFYQVEWREAPAGKSARREPLRSFEQSALAEALKAVSCSAPPRSGVLLCAFPTADALIGVIRRIGDAPIALLVASRNGVAAQPGEAPALDQSGLSAILATAVLEHPGLRCVQVDVDDDGAAALAAELAAGLPETRVAWRGGRRFLPRFVPLDVERRPPAARVRRGGTYIVTGGQGKVGGAIARFLAREGAARLILTGRTAREPAGVANAEAVAVDAADAQAMAALVDRIGPVDGIVHAAGLVAPQSLRRLADSDRDVLEAHRRPKVDGLRVILDLARTRRIPFVMAVSSLSALLGGVGLGAYGAANAEMDALAVASAGDVVTVDWDGWRFGQDALGLTDAQAEACLAQLFRHAVSGAVAVSVVPPELRAGPSRTAASPMERVSAIWAAVLGLPAVDPDQDILTLGGNSLMAAKIVSRLRSELQLDFPIRAMLEGATVRGIAADAGAPAPPPTTLRPIAAEAPPAAESGGGARIAPLSRAQERLYLIERLNANGPAYTIPLAFEVDGPFRPDAFAAAVRGLADRHETLRTTFAEIEGKAAQVIAPSLDLEVPILDAGTQARDRALDLVRRPFDLAAGPLLRACVLRIDERRHLCVLALHHLITDGWSIAILARELSALYAGALAGTPVRLPGVAPRYADVAGRLDLRGSGGRIEAWRDELSGLPELSSLPTDFPRSAVRDGKGALLRFGFPAALADELVATARRDRTTPFALLLATLALALRGVSGQPDLCIGAPVANRTRREAEDVPGLFVNMLPHRLRLEGDPTFVEAAAVAHRTAAWCADHQDIPFEDIVRIANPPRNPSLTPLFQVVLAYQNMASSLPAFEGTAIRRVDLDTGTAKFDLTLFIEEDEQGLSGVLEYAAGLFTPASAQNMADRLLAVLAAGLREPQTRASALPRLTAGEAEARRRYNDTAEALPVGRLHEAFLAQARLAPSRLAVIADDRTLGYGAVLARSAHLAHALRAAGARPNALVAVVMEKGWEQVVAVLATSMAGAAYLPVDPSYPAARVEALLSLGGVEIALTQSGVDRRLTWPGSVRRLVVDTLVTSEYPAEPPEANVSPNDLAYVIFTSGSTGTPKGVMIDHAGAANTCADVNRRFGLGPEDRVLAVSRLTFDLSVWDIFGTLGAGAALVIPREEESQDIAALAQRAADHRVTVWNSVPAFAGMLEEYLRDQDPSPWRALRLFMMSGDWIPVELPPRLRRLWPDAAVIGMGGATEASIWSILHPIGAVPPDWTCIPYGRPMANQTFHVLDAHLEPCADLVEGDLYIGGVGLAQGYWRAPDLTAASFITHPRTGLRLYRTGDRGRWVPGEDGLLVIEFMGRRDHQVKIRGFRVEIGEIEAVLKRHPAVRDAIVSTSKTASGALRLVAHIVGADAPIADLRRHAAERLPDYMVPAAWMRIDRVPLGANGKVDRSRLSQPAAAAIAPATLSPPEAELLALWRDILKAPALGPEDNFFEAGGDSIAGIRLVGRARLKGLALRPMDIFLHQTVRELAAAVTARDDAPPEPAAAAVDMPLTPPQLWFLSQTFAAPGHWNQALMLRVAAGLDPARLERGLRRLVAHHPALHARLGAQRMEAGDAAAITLNRIDLSGLEQPAPLVAQVCGALQSGLDPRSGRLAAAALFITGRAEDRLFLAVHHLAVDALSWPILLEDLAGLYDDIAPAPAGSYAHWAESLPRLAGRIAGQAAYWRSMGGPSTPLPLLSADPPCEAESRGLTLDFDPAALEAAGHRRDAVLLTLFARALCRWTGRSEARWLITMEGHGRGGPDGVDTSRTVGWFTALFPLAIEVDGGDPVGVALAKVGERLSAVPDGGAGYGVLRYFGDAATQDSLMEIRPEIQFNWLGRFPVDDARGFIKGIDLDAEVGPLFGPANRRTHALQLDAMLADHPIVRLRWGGPSFAEGEVERLAALLRDELCRWMERRDAPPVPLTPVQQGMVIHTMLASGDMYLVQLRAEFENLDAGALAAAWAGLAAEEPALRARILWRERDDPAQVAGEAPVLSQAETGDVDALARRDAALIDLERRPMVLTLAPVAAARHVLLWTMHHALLDGWSVSLVLGRLLDRYRRLRAGEAVEAAPRPNIFADYARWLGGRPDAAAYWRDHLAEAAPSRLPARFAGGDGSAEPVEWACGSALAAGLGRLARRARVGLPAVLQAAWTILLARHLGCEDLVCGMTFSGRSAPLPGIEAAVGMFINTLPLRCRLTGDPALCDWLGEMQAAMLAHAEHEHDSLPAIRAWAGIDQTDPVFEAVTVFETYPALPQNDQAELLSLSSRERNNYPLMLVVAGGEAPSFRLTFDPGRVARPTAEALLDRLRTLLEEMVRAPDGRLGELEILSPRDRAWLARAEPGPDRAWPEGSGVLERLDRSIAAYSERPAVACGAATMTYAEAGRAVGRVARLLRDHGIGPRHRVALCLERSDRMVVAMAGILASGAAIVPLDPGHPGDRLALALADAEISALFSDAALPLPAGAVRLELRAAAALEPLPPADWRAAPDDAAYVIFTSGSTGRPKGVEVTHGNLANLLCAMEADLEFGPQRRWLALTTPAFDIAMLELFLPLICGGLVDVAEAATALDPLRLIERIAGTAPDLIQATPATWRMLIEAGWTGAPVVALCGGEAMSAQLAEDLLARAAAVWNVYGPTETTIWSTAERVVPGRQVTIGRPLANTRLRILDSRLKPCPPGVAGELFIGGAGVARGYLGQPDLTAERFVATPEGRFYRTGDLACWRADERVDFLGRLDGQVKIRGFRVELGEVEAALARLDGLAAAAAAVHPDPLGMARLTAYGVLRPGAALTTEAMRRSLAAMLPDYMIPSRFVSLEALPLTANRKIDRRRLPPPGPGAPTEEDQGPLDETEARIAALWRDVLELTALPSRGADFFALGGHSLLAIRLAARLRGEFAVAPPVADLFVHSRLAAMADVVRLHRQAASLPDASDIAAMSEAELDALMQALEPAS